MPSKFRAILLSASVASLALATPAVAQDIDEQQVRAVLMAHPEIITEALTKAQEVDRQHQAERLKASVKPVADQILKGDNQVAFVGNPNGQPIVEFFDYNCGFCKRFHDETATALLAEGKTKLFLVHTPILGPGSWRLAEFAAAARLQGKFPAAHEFLSGHGAHDPASADQLIPDLIAHAKLDRAKFEKALADGSAKAEVSYNSALAQRAGVSGTPLIYARDQAIPGAIPLEPLKSLLR